MGGSRGRTAAAMLQAGVQVVFGLRLWDGGGRNSRCTGSPRIVLASNDHSMSRDTLSVDISRDQDCAQQVLAHYTQVMMEEPFP